MARTTSPKKGSSKRSSPKNTRSKIANKFPISRRLIVVLSVGAALVTAVGLYMLNSTRAVACTVDAKLVNSCRPWIGTASNGYPGVSGWKNHVLNFEKRAGRQVDVAHSYHQPPQSAVNAEEVSFINRPNTLLYMNWKPDFYWGPAGGSNAAVNGRIDKMADSIKSLGGKKIFLTVYHEPENDLSPGSSACKTAKGDKGTAAQYRAMWKNVRKRFDARGAKNVVWVMNYMGYSGWDCAVKDLWPGDDLVDWVTWDPYTDDKETFEGDIARFYNFLTTHTDATHDYTAKPWGIGEMGYEGADQKKAYKYYDDMNAVIKAKKFPNLKMYLFFDMNGKNFGGDPNWDSRINYAKSGALDNTEQQHFNTMFKNVASVTSVVPTKSTIQIANYKSGDTVKGKITISAGVADASTLRIVTLRVDGKWVATDEKSPYSLQLDTTKYSNGTHDVIMRSLDVNGKRTDSPIVKLNIQN